MRIPSGVTDQYIYFVAVDATDYVTRETGLSSFTVRRSRNGGASAAYTTPTINETDSSNMPGVYELLLDEDMTIDSGDQSQEVCLHITHAGMAPVTRIFELYRPDVTAGETLTVSSGNGNASVQVMGANTLTASALATDAVTEIQSGLATSAALATVDNNVDAILVDTDTTIPGLLTTIDSNVDAILVDTGTTLPGTLTTIEGKIDTVDSNVDAILVDTGTDIPATLATIDVKADDIITDLGTIDTTVDAILVDTGTDIPASLVTIDTNVDAILVDTGTTLDGKLDTLTTNVGTVDTTLDALVADIGSNGVGLTAIPWNSSWDAEVESEVTDALTAYDVATVTDVSGGTAPTVDQIADEIESRVLDANIIQVAGVPVNGSGTDVDPWGP